MLSILRAQLMAAAGRRICQLQTELDQLIADASPRIAEAEALAGALTSRGIDARAEASLAEMDRGGFFVSAWVIARGANVLDIEEALARADIRTTGVYPGICTTEIYTQPHGSVPIHIAHADIPAPAL